jgi:cytochrome P450
MQYKNLDFWYWVFNSISGWTSETRIFELRIIFTADPENIKAILATQFADYGKGEPFHKEWEEFLGDSIFTVDGRAWHDSRQLLRPQFVRDRVSDLHCFESHVQTLFRVFANGGALDGEDQVLDMTPGAADGKVFDISDIFFRYTLDVATDFLLGQDVKSMA